MTKKELLDQIRKKRSYLCIGLDTDINKIPKFLLEFDDPIYEFNCRIIKATEDLCVSYKLNIAFYESLGPAGWKSLQKTLDEIPRDIFTIADAKRGDIGNTSRMYAKTFFETYDFDSITVNPYMGRDSVQPFQEFDGKWVILLGLTSNPGSADFQLIKDEKGQYFYEHVFEVSKEWGSDRNLMYVVGATHPRQLAEIRQRVPNHFFLVPGVGAQGGDLKAISQAGFSEGTGGILVNSSRGIIYAGNDEKFDLAAREAAMDLKAQMDEFIP